MLYAVVVVVAVVVFFVVVIVVSDVCAVSVPLSLVVLVYLLTSANL